MTRLTPLTLGLLLAAAPAFAQQMDAGLDLVYERFVAAYAAADPDSVATLYTEDALYLPPQGDVIRGRAAIREVFAEFLGRYEPGRGPALDFEILERNMAGGLATDVGYFRLAGPGEPPRRAGKFVVVWKRGEDGAWRIHTDGYSGVPPPGE